MYVHTHTYIHTYIYLYLPILYPEKRGIQTTNE